MGRIVGWLVVVVIFIGGYRVISHDEDCWPSSFRIEPRNASVGSELVVTSKPFTCDRTYPTGARHLLLLEVPEDVTNPRSDRRSYDLGTFLVAQNGAFRARVMLPVTEPAPFAQIAVKGRTIRRLIDDLCPANANCVGPIPSFAIVAAR